MQSSAARPSLFATLTTTFNVVAGLVVALVLAIAVAPSSASATTTASIQNLSVPGVAAVDMVPAAEQFRPYDVYTFADGGLYDDKVFAALTASNFMTEALDNIDSLRQLGLCSDELTGEATARHTVANAGYQFPHDAPYNHDGVSADDAVFAAQLRTDAVVLTRAATLAASAHLPCSNPNTSRDASGNLLVRVSLPSHQPRILSVDDWSVLVFTNSVEQMFSMEGMCAPKLAVVLAKIKATPVATKVTPGADATFSERHKVSAIARVTGQLKLATSQGLPC